MAGFQTWSLRAIAPYISPGAGWVTISVGGLVLLGWSAGIESLKRVLPGLVSMNPMTAVCFILSGAALLLHSRKSVGKEPLVAEGLAVIVMIIGMIRLFGYVFDWAWGPDRWLFAESLEGDVITIPNRMSPNAALCFVLLGGGLGIMDHTSRKGWRLTELFALLITGISMLALVGYAYQISWLYEVSSFIPMALHTAGVFNLMAFGLMFARQDMGWTAFILSSSPGGQLIRRVFPVIVPALILLGWLRLAGERRGLYEAEVGTTFYTICALFMVSGLIWWSALSLHRAEQARRRVEIELERFFTLSLDMLCIAGTDGYFKRINPAFSKTLGYTTGELLARPFIEFVHPEDRECTLIETGQIQAGEPMDHFENRYLCKDGSLRWFWWKGHNLEDEGLIYANARDVTDQKKAQEEIRLLNETLRERASQLDASNQELEAFSYSVSHDLRAPLRGISGFAQALEEHSGSSLDATSRGYLMRVRRAADRMGYLIDDLLKLSRLTRTEMHLEAVDLSAQAESILTQLSQREPERSVQWYIRPDIIVQADEALMRVLMENLLENAWKFTSKNSAARIEVGTMSTETNPNVCYVRDNGVGFDMRYASKLFGAFQRLHSMVEFPGTGIGLATVQRVVRRHGGRVWADAQINVGSTFYFVV